MKHRIFIFATAVILSCGFVGAYVVHRKSNCVEGEEYAYLITGKVDREKAVWESLYANLCGVLAQMDEITEYHVLPETLAEYEENNKTISVFVKTVDESKRMELENAIAAFVDGINYYENVVVEVRP